jgi:PAS domain S-box-containing protein
MVAAAEPAAVRAFGECGPVLDALSRAVVVTDTVGTVVGWNRSAESLFGWKADEVIGESIADVVKPAAGVTPDRSVVLRAVIGGTTWRSDFRVLRRDGSPFRIFSIITPLRDSEARIVGTVAAVEDVTDQRIMEQRAADLTEHLRLALDAGALGTWRWDIATGTVTWDERVEQLFGLDPGEFDGSFETWVALLHPEDRDNVLAVVNRAVETMSSYQVDHRVIWRDGSVHWLQGRGSVTVGHKGNVTGTIGCIGDITAAKVAEVDAKSRAAQSAIVAERERRQRERLEFLVSLGDATLAADSHQALMRAITSAAVPRLGDWCSLHFASPRGDLEVDVAHSDPDKVAWAKALAERYPYDPTSKMGVAEVIRSGKLEFLPHIDDAVIDEALEQSAIDRREAMEILQTLSLTSVITAPLITKRGVIGAMQFVSAESGRHYDEDDVALARVAAARIADALENAWLTDEHRQISVSLQKSFLPPAVAPIPGLDVAVRYWPAGSANEVGGDFYDVFKVEEDRWALVIGDVCGSGANAAALTGIVRHTIRAAARHGQDHATVLEWINEAVLYSGRDLFCTTCYATIEGGPHGHRLASISGGHPLPIIVRANGEATVLGEPGTLLGVFDDITASVAETPLQPDDVVVFYTDGVTDMPPPHGLALEELIALVTHAVRAASAEEVADNIDRALDNRLPESVRRDDIALVVVRQMAPPVPG